MMIIVIGPDKSGKSTLVDLLAKHYGWETYHGLYIKEPLVMTQRVMNGISLFSTVNIICDRFQYPEDLIYAPVIEGKVSVFEAHRKAMDTLLVDTNAFIIYCDTPSIIIDRRYRSLGGDDYVPVEKIEEIQQRYKKYLRYTRVRHASIDCSQTPQACFKRAIRLIDCHMKSVAKGVKEYLEYLENKNTQEGHK